MFELKRTLVRHDQKALLRKASTSEGFKEAFADLSRKYQAAHQQLKLRTRMCLIGHVPSETVVAAETTASRRKTKCQK